MGKKVYEGISGFVNLKEASKSFRWHKNKKRPLVNLVRTRKGKKQDYLTLFCFDQHQKYSTVKTKVKGNDLHIIIPLDIKGPVFGVSETKFSRK